MLKSSGLSVLIMANSEGLSSARGERRESVRVRRVEGEGKVQATNPNLGLGRSEEGDEKARLGELD